MGADFLCMVLDWERKGKRESMEDGWKRTLDAIDKRIDKIKRLPSLNDIDDISGGEWQNTEDGIVDGNADILTIDGYQTYLYDLVDSLRSCWGGRDNTVILLGNRFVFITGGMSWGDSPTDTFNILTRLQAAGIT